MFSIFLGENWAIEPDPANMHAYQFHPAVIIYLKKYPLSMMFGLHVV